MSQTPAADRGLPNRVIRPSHCPDVLAGETPGRCREIRDGSGLYYVRGRAHTERVDPKTWRCTCGIGLPRGAEPLTDCEHIRSLRAFLRSGERECPACRGSGERPLKRAELEALLSSGRAITYQPSLCAECGGKGLVPLARYRELQRKEVAS